MPGNPFYKSAFWDKLKTEALARAKRRCEVPGCGKLAAVVDHIITRPRGEEGPTAWDRPGNLRCLCRTHDNQVKEKRDGTRRNDGKFYIPGFDRNGFPLDPNHPWYNGGKDEG